MTVPDAVAVLFDSVGSVGDVDVTVAVLLTIVPPPWSAAIVPVAVTVTWPPLASVPIVHEICAAAVHVAGRSAWHG